jgi:hypothetical protein
MSTRLIATLTAKLQEHLLFLPQNPADRSDYEGWGRKFIELWVSRYLDL